MKIVERRPIIFNKWVAALSILIKRIQKLSYLRTSIFNILIFFVTYLIYVYPLCMLNYLIFDENILTIHSFFITTVLYTLIIYFFKSDNKFFLLKVFVYGGMGAGFIGFWVVNLGLLVNVFYPETNPFLGLICILAILTITITSLVEGKSLYIKKLEIFSTKVEKEIRLIFISDTHLGSNSKDHLKKIISKVQSLEFDLFLIGGDFIDSGSFDLDDLDLLKAVNRPILFISGNHEYYLKDYEHKLKKLKNYNVIFLNNEAYKYKNLQVIGICDNETVSSQEMITNKLVKDGFFNLVLVHKPSLWDQVCKEIDLMLSGHTHNGQIFPFNFFVRMRFRYIYGLYEKLNSKLYVSSGSGCWGPKMRLGTKNEIVNIVIANR